MHVIFVEPVFPGNQREFVRALRSVGAKVTGIGEVPVDCIDQELKGWMYSYHQVSSVCHYGDMLRTVREIQKREKVHRMEVSIEAHVMTTARVREACGIPGLSVHTSWLCRDKPAMKETLRKAGVPCAESTGAESGDEVRAFIKRVGLPIIIKPRDAAGAAGTWKVEHENQLPRVFSECGVDKGRSVAVEEFIEGHEGFYDTIAIDGRVAHEFVTHYYPGVLEAMRTRETPAYFITTNRLEEPSYDEVRKLGRTVIRELGISTSATHMEWFFGPKGLKFSEIGCRPPGVGAWDVYSQANDLDVYREWAMAIVHGGVADKPSRRYSAVMLSLRPEADGRISHYEGLETIERKYGQHIMDVHIPPPGSRTQPISAGYKANAWMRLRHTDYDICRAITEDIGKTVKIRVQPD